MLALLDYISSETRSAFYKELLEGLLASDEVLDSDKEKLKGFGSITFIEVEGELEEGPYGIARRSEIIYTIYGEPRGVKSASGGTISRRGFVKVKEDALISAY